MNAETFLQILLPIWRSSLPSNIPPGYLDGFVARKRDDILRTLQPAVDLLNEQRRKRAELEEKQRVEAERAEEEHMGAALRGARDQEEARWNEALDKGTMIEMSLGLDAESAKQAAVRNITTDLSYYDRDLVEKRLPDGALFPVYNGELLSWDIGANMTPAEERHGYPRVRAVIQAMRRHRPQQLRREHFNLVTGSFDKIFGHNSRTLLKLVESEAPELTQPPATLSVVPSPPPAPTKPVQHTLASTGLQPLGTPSKKILDTITAGLTHPADEGKSSRKIDRAPGAYMAVYVERIGDDRYSVAHYFTQNGDRVADPDIEFERENGEWYPAAAQMAVGTYHRAFEHDDDGRILYRPKTYRSIAQLANVLLRNIKAQQDIVIGESFDEAPPLPPPPPVVPSVVETPPLPSPLPPPPQTPTGLFRLIRQKDGGWNAQLTDRVSKPDFIRLLKISSALRGNYSSTRPAGFRFQQEADARSFISQIDEIPDALIPVYDPPKSGLQPGWTDDPATLDRMRKLVEASQRLDMKLPKQAAWLAKVMDQSGALPGRFKSGKSLEEFLTEAEAKVARSVKRQPKAKQLQAEGGIRQATTETEEAAAAAVVSLAGMDPDRAREKNFAGFDKADGATGHEIAMRIQSGIGLTDAEWDWAKRALKKYRRQVGAPVKERKARVMKPKKLTGDELIDALTKRLKVFEYGEAAQFYRPRSKDRWEIGVDGDGRFYTSTVDGAKTTTLSTEAIAARHLVEILKGNSADLLATLYPGYRVPVGSDIDFLEAHPPTPEFFERVRRLLEEIRPINLPGLQKEVDRAETAGATYAVLPLLRRAAHQAITASDLSRSEKEALQRQVDQLNTTDVSNWPVIVEIARRARPYREAHSVGHEDPATIPELERMVRKLEEHFEVERLGSGHGYRRVKLRTRGGFAGLPPGTDLVEVTVHYPKGSLSSVPNDFHNLQVKWHELGLPFDEFRKIKRYLKNLISVLVGEGPIEALPLPMPDDVLDAELKAWEDEKAAKEEKINRFSATPRALYGPMEAFGGGMMFIHPDQQPGMWRQTRFDQSSKPIGHFGPSPFRDVVVAASYDGDINGLKAVNKRGEVEALPRKVKAQLVVPADKLWRVTEALPTDPFRERGDRDSITSKLRNLYYHNFGVDSKAILTVGRDHRVGTGDEGRLHAEEFRLWAHKDGVPSDDPSDPVYWLWILGRSDYAFLKSGLQKSLFDRLFSPELELYTDDNHHRILANPQMMRRLANYDPDLIRPLLFTSHVSQRDVPRNFWTAEEREELNRTWVNLSARERLKRFQAQFKSPKWKRLDDQGYTLSEVFPDIREEALPRRKKVPAKKVNADAVAHMPKVRRELGSPQLYESDGKWELVMDAGAADPYNDQQWWAERGRTGGGYDWKDLVRQNLSKQALAALTFDPESQMLVVVSDKREPVAQVDSLLRRLLASPMALAEAIRGLPATAVEALPLIELAEYDALIPSQRARLSKTDAEVGKELARFIQRKTENDGERVAFNAASDFIDVWGEAMHLRAHGWDAVPVLGDRPSLAFVRTDSGKVYAFRSEDGTLTFRDGLAMLGENVKAETHNRYRHMLNQAEAFMDDIRNGLDITPSRSSSSAFIKDAEKIWSRARKKLAPVTSTYRGAHA